MKLTKIEEFKPSDIDIVISHKITTENYERVTKDKTYRVILIDETHYIGSYLSTGQIAPISLDGIRYNVIDEVDFNSESVNAQIFTVPTGVTTRSQDDVQLPRAFKFHDIIVFENKDMVTSIDLYVDDTLVATISEIGMSDRLIIVTEDTLNLTQYHESSRAPHNFDRSYLTQARIAQFDTLTGSDELNSIMPSQESNDSLFSGFKVFPPHTRVKYDADYTLIISEIDSFTLDSDRLDMETSSIFLITRKFSEPTVPVLTDKFI